LIVFTGGYRAMKKDALNRVIQYAADNVPYYNTLYRGIDLACESKLPIVWKSDILGREDELISRKFTKESLELDFTTGTSGTPLHVYRSRQDTIIGSIPLWRARRWYGVNCISKQCHFYYGFRCEDNTLTFQRIKMSGNVLKFSVTDLSSEAMYEYYIQMMHFGPIWFQSIPSAFTKFSIWMLNNGLIGPDTLKLIELNGELVLPSQRAIIQAAFPASCIANLYGTVEVWAIAYECPNGHLHILEDSVYPTVHDTEGRRMQDGVLGGLVITTLLFEAMPFIRYWVGDRVSIEQLKEDCPYGKSIIGIHSGRTEEYAKTLQGNEIHSVFFIGVTEAANITFPNAIRQYQVVQKADHSLIISIVPGPGWSNSTQNYLMAELRKQFPDEQITIVETRDTGVDIKQRRFMREN